jgi:Protein of unknown function (DUF2589)
MTEGERNIQQAAGTPQQATDGGQVAQNTGTSPGEVGIPDGAQMAAAGEAVGGAVSAAVQAAPDGPAALTAPNFATELGNIDFQKMIGGPLQAAVDAQVASSLATINFINAVGFTAADAGGKRELVMVDFTHTRKDVDADGKATTKDVALKVPLLAMLPIPSLRIEQVVIDFNVKLNSVESSSVSDDLNVKADLAVGWGPVNFKVSASYQRKTTTNVEVKREYALAVNVKAVQDEIPAGLEKVLGMLAA